MPLDLELHGGYRMMGVKASLLAGQGKVDGLRVCGFLDHLAGETVAIGADQKVGVRRQHPTAERDGQANPENGPRVETKSQRSGRGRSVAPFIEEMFLE